MDFVQPLIEHYNTTFAATTPFLRGDSGFTVPALYELCEKESVYYVIRLKSNANLQRSAEELYLPAALSYVTETEYRAKSWFKSRRLIVQSVRPVGELFFTHSFYVTNLVDVFTLETIVRTYQKRGTMENYIKEVKKGFGFYRMNSHSFQVNQTRMIISLLAYNLTNWLRTLCLRDGLKIIQIGTTRTRIITVTSKVVKSGRRLRLKLTSSFVYQSFFWNVLWRVQTCSCRSHYISILKSQCQARGAGCPQ